MHAVLLLLADGRLPTGGHAHSGGIEEACVSGLVTDESSLANFLLGRLHTVGLVSAGAAAAACAAATDPTALGRLDVELDARTPGPAARAVSRSQGRGLLRVARRMWPTADWPLPSDSHHALVLGVVVATAGGTPYDAATVAAWHAVSGPASAAVRLLGLDPLTVAAMQARRAPAVDSIAAAALAAVRAGHLPAASAPWLELAAERHVARPTTLFAS